MNTAIVIGVGPDRGLGAQLCRRFAGLGLRVFVAGRTRESLDAVVANIEADGGVAEAVVTDATDEGQVASLFDAAGDGLTLVVYNVGNNTPGRIADMEAGYFEAAWRTGCFGGFLVGREAVRRFLAGNSVSSGDDGTGNGGAATGTRGTLLFTGASASLRGRANFGAFNSAKGALRNLAQAMAKEYGPEGVHVGHVVIDGGIAGEKIFRRVPELAESSGGGRLISLEGIVDGYVHLYRQPPTAWTFELDLRTSVENW
ncbi:MAG: SDR family NAD(P)-dependent oxidoreductase [Gammaproteobacteria bacterium]|nr:SDR family NAD(P)-dependent oxidoreductase [Gammaproteobacteria bacterium]